MLRLFAPNVPKLEAKREVPGLLRLLQADDDQVRADAATALGRLGDRSAVEPLVAALADPDVGVRDAAMGSLGLIGDPRACGPLVGELAAADPARSHAPGRALRVLLERAPDRQQGEARAALVEGLTRYPAVVEDLLQGAAADRGRDALRGAALQALERLGDPWTVARKIGAVTDTSLPREVREYAAGALARLGAAGVEPLGAALRDPGSATDLRLAAVAALSAIGDRRAVPALLDALAGSRPPLRAQAAAALGRIGDPAAVDALTVALADGDEHVRERAVEALARIGPAAVPALVGALTRRGTTKDVRSAAASALGELGDARAADALAAALDDRHGSVRRAAILALRRLGDQRADQPLEHEIDVELRNLFLTPREEPRTCLDQLVPTPTLSTAVAGWAVQASGYEKAWGSGLNDQQYVDLASSDAAVRHLSDLDVPVTSNILRLLSRKPDISVSLAICAFSQEEDLSFAHQRAAAEAELHRRGDPPYRAEAYVRG